VGCRRVDTQQAAWHVLNKSTNGQTTQYKTQDNIINIIIYSPQRRASETRKRQRTAKHPTPLVSLSSR